MTEFNCESVWRIVVDTANVSNRTSRSERRFRCFGLVRVGEAVGEASRGCGGGCGPELLGFLMEAGREGAALQEALDAG